MREDLDCAAPVTAAPRRLRLARSPAAPPLEDGRFCAAAGSWTHGKCIHLLVARWQPSAKMVLARHDDYSCESAECTEHRYVEVLEGDNTANAVDPPAKSHWEELARRVNATRLNSTTKPTPHLSSHPFVEIWEVNKSRKEEFQSTDKNEREKHLRHEEG